MSIAYAIPKIRSAALRIQLSRNRIKNFENLTWQSEEYQTFWKKVTKDTTVRVLELAAFAFVLTEKLGQTLCDPGGGGGALHSSNQMSTKFQDLELNISRSFRIFQDHFEFFKTISNASKSFRMFQDHFEFFKTISNVSRSFRMFQDHFECFKTISNVSRSFRMFQDH